VCRGSLSAWLCHCSCVRAQWEPATESLLSQMRRLMDLLSTALAALKRRC